MGGGGCAQTTAATKAINTRRENAGTATAAFGTTTISDAENATCSTYATNPENGNGYPTVAHCVSATIPIQKSTTYRESHLNKRVTCRLTRKIP